MAATWLKILPDGSETIKLINTDHYKEIVVSAGDPENKTDIIDAGGHIITISVPIATVISFLNPILIREDELGNAL